MPKTPPTTAYLFDMDDLLVHSRSTWHAAVLRLLYEHTQGDPQAVAERLDYRGLSAQDTARMIHEQLELQVPADTFLNRFNQILLDQVSSRGVDPLPGAQSTVRWAQAHGRVAVASGSPLPVIHSALSSLGLSNEVEVAVSSHHVERGKPWPDVFLEAARRLKMQPNACVVFEDSLVGVQAAVRAGMICVAVPSEQPAEIAELTPHVYDSLLEVHGALSSGRLQSCNRLAGSKVSAIRPIKADTASPAPIKIQQPESSQSVKSN